MKFSPPRLSDEEERSPHMPDYLLCDGCVAVATQLQLGFLLRFIAEQQLSQSLLVLQLLTNNFV